MPELMNTSYRVDELVDATIYLLNAEGIESFTLRKIAAVARLSPSSVTSHLENKARMTDLVMKGIAGRLDHELSTRVRTRGALALVPDETVLVLLRPWLAMCEFARADDQLAAGVAHQHDEQRYVVQWACRIAPEDHITLDTMHALVVGLWTAMCARSNAMTPEQATAVLRHACGAFDLEVGPEED